ncbi:alpha/beta fold hydrolase [Nocardiopsis sp. CC223A]|uniref:alpha/beta fold hydrolase n=1 Tax=Nocardiopsis sp. CC223A TaxID=3044051 RepID=UPI00278C74AC|nr:alpha/beta fold hydrolase [Nocardiopsis sp. CC223A]
MIEHYARTVKGSGPGLLLAHGGGGGIEPNFGPLLADLARTHTVVGPDLPGSGDTPRATGPLDLDTVADSLVAAAVEEGVERFTVLGYSLGTAVAVRAATRHPERVTGLILTAGFARIDNRTRLNVDVWRTLLDGDRDTMARFTVSVGFGTPALEALDADGLEEAVRGVAGSVPAGTPEQVELVARVDTRADLPGIAVPTLVVAAALDRLASPELSRALAAGIPGAELVEIASGHLVAAEAPEEWGEAVRGFLDRNP